MDQKFRKKERLRLKRDFNSVFQEGNRIVCKELILIYKKNNLNFSRLGIVVSKKFGKAVLRNRFKRLVREFFRKNKEKIPYSCDIVIIARRNYGKDFKNVKYYDLESILMELIRRIK